MTLADELRRLIQDLSRRRDSDRVAVRVGPLRDLAERALAAEELSENCGRVSVGLRGDCFSREQVRALADHAYAWLARMDRERDALRRVFLVDPEIERLKRKMILEAVGFGLMLLVIGGLVLWLNRMTELAP